MVAVGEWVVNRADTILVRVGLHYFVVLVFDVLQGGVGGNENVAGIGVDEVVLDWRTQGCVLVRHAIAGSTVHGVDIEE